MFTTFLYTIEEAFNISGRGCVLAPGMSATTPIPVRQGDRVRLVQPSGMSFESTVQSLDAIHDRRTDSPEIRILVVLPKSVDKRDVPLGTQLVLLGATDTIKATASIQLSIFDRPRNVNLDQFILAMTLSYEKIEEKYALSFEQADDDLSPVRLAFLSDGMGHYFLILARPDIEDFPVSVFTTAQEDLTSSIEHFITLLGVDRADISNRIDEAY